MTLRAVVVDDEELARRLLVEQLEEDGEVQVVAECANGFEAVKAVAETGPDVVFLDIQMPKLDGFEVVQLLSPLPAVVFVTAYDQYAIRAFEEGAIDYLLKPYNAARAFETCKRVRARLAASPASVSGVVERLTAGSRT